MNSTNTKSKVSVPTWLVFTVLGFINLVALVWSIWHQNQISIVLEWSTESEFNMVGFDILRGDSDSGPFTKINQSIIPPSIDPVIGGDYQFIDKNVSPGGVYYYILEDIEMDGTRHQHGPVIQEAEDQSYLILVLTGMFLLNIGICAREYIKVKPK